MYNIHLLPASFGDAILIEFGKAGSPKYILVDGGPYFNFPSMYEKMKVVAPSMKEIELVIVTHIDIDHIDGLITILNHENQLFKIKEIWFNGYEQLVSLERNDLLGALQGEYLSNLIATKKIPHNVSFQGKAVYVDAGEYVVHDVSGFEITVLAPDRKALSRLAKSWKTEIKDIGGKEAVLERWQSDKRYTRDDLLGDEEDNLSIEEMMESNIKGDRSIANQSSIAFVGKYEGKACLFAGDSPTDNLLPGIESFRQNNKPLKLDAWKLAHHGSKSSTLDPLMKKINCKHILISSNGTRFGHPHPTCIAKLVKNNGPGLNFYFNYRSEVNERWIDTALIEKYGYENHYPEDGDEGITVALGE